MIGKINFVLCLLLGSQVAMAQEGKYQEGKHYFKIDQATQTAATDSVEVTEFFSYNCSHCNTFEPYMQSWLKSKPEYINVSRVGVAFGRRAWELMARGYVTAEMMGIAEQSHVPMMDAIWKQRTQFRSVEQLAEFYTQFGVEKDAFLAHFKSFAADSQMRRGQKDAQAFGVRGTPSLVVARKYRVSSSQDVTSYEVMLDIVNYLAALEFEENATAGGENAGQ